MSGFQTGNQVQVRLFHARFTATRGFYLLSVPTSVDTERRPNPCLTGQISTGGYVDNGCLLPSLAVSRNRTTEDC
jgi:hypothetical protein